MRSLGYTRPEPAQTPMSRKGPSRGLFWCHTHFGSRHACTPKQRHTQGWDDSGLWGQGGREDTPAAPVGTPTPCLLEGRRRLAETGGLAVDGDDGQSPDRPASVPVDAVPGGEGPEVAAPLQDTVVGDVGAGPPADTTLIGRGAGRGDECGGTPSEE